MRIAFTGRPGCGKDECVRYLQGQLPGVHLKFATPLYQVADHALQVFGLPLDKSADRALLAAVSKWVAGRAPDALVRSLLARVPVGERVFVSDLRDRRDAVVLQDQGFKIVRVEKAGCWDRPDELDSFDKFDFTVRNSGTLAQLHANLDTMCQEMWP